MIKMKCLKCKKHEIELSRVDMNLDRKGIRVWVTCPECEFTKILELDMEDIIGKCPEITPKMRIPSGNPRVYW